MRLLNFLSGIAPVLVCLAAPIEGGGGTTDPQPESPTGDTPEAKYTSALRIIGDYFKQLSGAMREKDEAVGQVAGLTARAEKAEKELKEERDLHIASKENLSALNSQLVGVTKERDTAQSRVTLIESYCKHSNVDLAGLEKFQAAKTPEGAGPDNGGNAEGKALHDQYEALKKDPKKSKQATAFFRKHKAELQEYAASLKD